MFCTISSFYSSRVIVAITEYLASFYFKGVKVAGDQPIYVEALAVKDGKILSTGQAGW